MGLALTPLILKNPFGKVELPKRMSWTSSSMKLFRSCRRKWFWKYIMRLRPRQRDKNLMIGSIFHETLGEWYRGRRSKMEPIAERNAERMREEIEQMGDWFDQEEIDELKCAATTFVGMMVGYATQYEEDRNNWNIRPQSIEYKFKIDMGDFDFEGKMDLCASHRQESKAEEYGLFLAEHKTAAKIDENYINRLPLDTQIRGYTFAARHKMGLNLPVDHVMYDVVRKCKLRRKGGETVEQFNERVAQDYLDRPSFYFYREPLRFKEEHLAAFEHELRQTNADYEVITRGIAGKIITPKMLGEMGVMPPEPLDPRTWLPNDSQCYNFFRECEFLSLCTQGLKRSTSSHLVQSEHMHMELTDAE